MAASRYNQDRRYQTNYWDSSAPHHTLNSQTLNNTRKIICMAIIAVLVFLTTIIASVWLDFSSTISSRVIKTISTSTKQIQSIDPNAGKTINILVLGQDTREGKNRAFQGGGEDENHQSDTAMIVQISADRSYINIVSIPRDSMVKAASCNTSNGRIPARRKVMFNSIFALGYAKGGDLASAASCTLATVNEITGLNITDFIVADFSGLSDMINAIGGVTLCIPVNTRDYYTGVNLKRGLQHLDGVQATQYARMRHDSASDGSDIMRTTRQQYLLKQLIHQALSKNLLTQSGQLYQLAKSALKSLNMSQGLANPTTLVGLAASLRNLKPSHIYAQTIPIATDPYDENRVILDESAQDVWDLMQEDKPLTKDLGEKPSKSKKSSKKNSKSSKKSASKENSDSSSADSNDSAESTNSGENSLNSSNSYADPNAVKIGRVDPKTGLAKDSLGRLIDPNSGGIVNPEDGTIRNPQTGHYMGIADKYLNNTICAVPKGK